MPRLFSSSAALCTAAALAALAASAQTRPAVPASFESDYLHVLHIMKAPPATGVLIADLTSDGPAARAGLQPGDIIISYDSHPIESLQTLKEFLANALAAPLRDPKINPKVDVKIIRDAKPLILQVDRGGLQITPISVQSGVALPLNPPPSPNTPQDPLPLAWDSTIPTGGIEPVPRYFVLYSGDKTPWGYMQWTLSRSGAAVESGLKAFTSQNLEIPAFHITTRFTVSSGTDLPPFLLDTLSYDAPAGRFQVQRQGAKLVQRDQPDPPRPPTTPTLMEAIPLESGIEALAAAMPHQAGKVLAFPGLDPASLQTRPGCALVTLGQRQMPVDKQNQPLWGVSQMRFGQTEMTWWFDDQRRLILIEAPDLHAQSVPSEFAAKALLKPAP